MTRSAFIAAQACEHGRGWLLPRLKRKRRRKLLPLSCGWIYLASRAQPFKRACLRQRREQRHRAATVGHFDRLAGRDSAQELARALSQLPHSHTRHVLLIAHSVVGLPGGERAGADTP